MRSYKEIMSEFYEYTNKLHEIFEEAACGALGNHPKEMLEEFNRRKKALNVDLKKLGEELEKYFEAKEAERRKKND